MQSAAFWSGWIMFAAVMMGAYNALQGLAAIFSDGYHVALAVVGLNAVAQGGFLAAFPLWAIVVIALSALVIFGLTAKWG
jgi:hypothetical protein